MTEKTLIADMRALLDALDTEKVEGNDRAAVQVSTSNQNVTPTPSSSSSSLEDKLGQLLGALKSNNADEWSGKPAQDDLGLKFSFEGNGETGGSEKKEEEPKVLAEESLDSLMHEYVGAVKQVWSLDESDKK